MRRVLPLLAVLVCVVAARPSVRVAAHPDFSGTWALDVAKSQSPMLPMSQQLKITQTETSLTIDRSTTSAMGTQSGTMKYTLDGAPSKNTITANGGMTVEFNSTTTWSGDTLVIKTTANLANAFSQTERYALAADKKTMTVDGEISIGPQSATAKLVFNKQ